VIKLALRNKEIALLWSGGLDSTIMLQFLLSAECHVKCYHILIRNGCGKDIREKKAIESLLPLFEKHPSFSFEEIRHRIRPCDDRNLKMINLIKTSIPVAIGTLRSDNYGNYPTTDEEDEYLTKKSGVKVITWDTLGLHTFEEVYAFGLRLLGRSNLEKTWSCQLWWKKPCGKCYSCKRREAFLNTVKLK